MDSTAGMGGNTIHFSKFFRKVIAIDIDNLHFNVLKNNVEALSLKNTELYHDSFLNHLDKKIDILFFDPPWGGNSYKKFKYFNLTFLKQRIQ
jgi:16S rRNA G966 N2-methylase RsmD